MEVPMPDKQFHITESRDYERLRPIFAGLAETHLNVVAVLDGNCPGEIYVDDLRRPQSALLVSGDGYYLAGQADNLALNRALNEVLPRDHYFVLFCSPEQWATALDVILEDTYAIRAPRRYYTLGQPRIRDWQNRIPDGYEMRRIDAQLLDTDRENREGVVGGILDGWLSIDAFLEGGFGFSLVQGDEIVSWSLSDYVKGDRCEIGINTAWHHRRQGLGTLTAAATAAHAAAQGFVTVGWHCWDNNVGSIGVAGNVGFQISEEYDVYINHWVAENISDMSQHQFQSFARFYEREFNARPPATGFPYVVAAKAWALSGDRAGCFRHLHKAIDVGWLRGVEHLRQIWPELWFNPHLEEMEEWQALIVRFQQTNDQPLGENENVSN
jgi:hypothetical protein